MIWIDKCPIEARESAQTAPQMEAGPTLTHKVLCAGLTAIEGEYGKRRMSDWDKEDHIRNVNREGGETDFFRVSDITYRASVY